MPLYSSSRAARGRQALLEPLDRELGHALLDEAHAEHARALEEARLVLGRELELGDGLVDEAHLLVGDAEVVAGLVVLLAELLVDALLELAEDVRERGVAEVGGRRRPALGRHRGLGPEEAAELGGQVEPVGPVAPRRAPRAAGLRPPAEASSA